MSEKKIEVKIIQPLEISETEGFERDKLDRERFGEAMAQILENQPGGNVFALDAGWGQGKTTFIKMWRGHVGYIRENKLQTIYFDAFACDYQQDPFLALAAEVYERVRGAPLKKAILSVEKLRAINSMVGGALLEKTVGKTGGDIVKKFLEAHDAILTRRLEEALKAKGAIETFRESLEKHVKKISPDKSLIFIVDELDRCRPDFALDLLETIKHFFEVPGIVFLLVMNHEALDGMIRTRYGINDGPRYMQKFVQFWFSLPAPKSEKHVEFMYEESSIKSGYTCELTRRGSVSLREIQQIRLYEELIRYFIGSPFPEERWVISTMSYVKVVKPAYIQKILNMNNPEIGAFEWREIFDFSPVGLFADQPNIERINNIREDEIDGRPISKLEIINLIRTCARVLTSMNYHD